MLAAAVNLTPADFGLVNYAVLAVYLLGMLVLGLWAGRRTKGATAYFTAEGHVHHVLVGLSLLGTYLSSITMMSLPAFSFGVRDWTWAVQLPFLIVTALVITRVVLPRYRREGCLSVYEFLERRIHVSSRLFAALAFIALSIGRMGLVLYLPSLAFHIVTGADLVTTIVVMGVVTVVYTVLGGIKGIIWTDAAQVVIFVAGAVVTVFFVFTPGQDFFAVADEHHKFRFLDWRADVTQEVTYWLVLQTLFETVRIYATQQEMTQRYLTAESTQRANQSVWISILGYIPLGFLFYFIGTGLFVFYQTHADPAVAELASDKRLDALYPYFVVTQMPAGLSGLVVAAFAAAAMSTISSSMNSCSAVCLEDFYKRFVAPGLSEEHSFAWAKRLSWVWGALSIAAALLCIQIESAVVIWSKMMAVSTCGLLGLMALAFLPRRIHAWAALTGVAASYACLLVMMFFLQATPSVALVWAIPEGGAGVNFLLWPVISNLVCFGVALGVDAALGHGFGFRAQSSELNSKTGNPEP
jgi:SSS family transporter